MYLPEIWISLPVPSRLQILSSFCFLVFTFLLPGKSSKLKLHYWKPELEMWCALCSLSDTMQFHLGKTTNLGSNIVIHQLFCFSSFHFNSGWPREWMEKNVKTVEISTVQVLIWKERLFFRKTLMWLIAVCSMISKSSTLYIFIYIHKYI